MAKPSSAARSVVVTASDWQSLCRMVPEHIAGFFRYYHLGSKRAGACEKGKVFDLDAADSEGELPKATEGTYRVELLRQVLKDKETGDVDYVVVPLDPENPGVVVEVHLSGTSIGRSDAPRSFEEIQLRALHHAQGQIGSRDQWSLKMARKGWRTASEERKKKSKWKKRYLQAASQVPLVDRLLNAFENDPEGFTRASSRILPMIFDGMEGCYDSYQKYKREREEENQQETDK